MPRAAQRWFSPLLLALSLLLAAALPARAAVTRVTGQVLDAETQQPVAGAEIELQNSGGGPGYFRVKADAKGEFVLENVATSRYYLFTVGREGYSDWALEGWQFPASQRDVRIVVPLERAGVVRVKVTGATGGKAVAGARVTVRNERERMWWENASRDPEPRFTNGAGEVEFTGLTAGYWSVSVEAAGLRSEEAHRVPVRRGETSPVSLVLARPASLSGAVRLADSTGVAGVSVIARGPGEATRASCEATFSTTPPPAARPWPSSRPVRPPARPWPRSPTTSSISGGSPASTTSASAATSTACRPRRSASRTSRSIRPCSPSWRAGAGATRSSRSSRAAISYGPCAPPRTSPAACRRIARPRR